MKICKISFYLYTYDEIPKINYIIKQTYKILCLAIVEGHDPTKCLRFICMLLHKKLFHRSIDIKFACMNK